MLLSDFNLLPYLEKSSRTLDPLVAAEGVVNPLEMEQRIEALERQNAMLWGAMLFAAGMTLLRRYRQFYCKTIVTERILLAAGGGEASGGLASLFRKPVVAGEIGSRAGRPEVRLMNGSIVLMDAGRNTRVQIDAGFRPAPPLQPPTERAVEAHNALRWVAGKPAIVFKGAEEEPQMVVTPHVDHGVSGIDKSAFTPPTEAPERSSESEEKPQAPERA